MVNERVIHSSNSGGGGEGGTKNPSDPGDVDELRLFCDWLNLLLKVLRYLHLTRRPFVGWSLRLRYHNGLMWIPLSLSLGG